MFSLRRRHWLALASGFLLVFLLVLWMEFFLPLISVRDVVLGLPPVAAVCRHFFVPTVFQGEEGFDVSVKTMDGLGKLKGLIALDEDKLNFKRRDSASFALAIPFNMQTSADVIELLKGLKGFRASVDSKVAEYMDVVLFFHDTDVTYWGELGFAFQNKVGELAKAITGAEAHVVIVGSLDVRSAAQFIPLVSCLDHVGYEAFVLLHPMTWSLQDGWGDSLLALVMSREEFWVKGSVGLGWRTDGSHFKDTTIVRLGQNGFYVFLYLAFKDHLKESRVYCLNELVGKISCSWHEYRLLMRKLSFAFEILDLNNEVKCVPDDNLVSKHPHAYLLSTRPACHRIS